MFSLSLDENDADGIENPLPSGFPGPGPLVMTGLLNEGTYRFEIRLQSGFDEIESETASTVVDFIAFLAVPEPTTATLMLFGGLLITRRRLVPLIDGLTRIFHAVRRPLQEKHLPRTGNGLAGIGLMDH